ncbi:MAG TPA: hypothetical protein IAC79_03720 [Candidatus Spyradenecus faecavium]|uniref:Septum formation initiator family protein n=1 Tax=Candidatus Spyradenecus faecavium TaxID=2840947 RepID=A0A9D1NMR6_9BACT|nr:hypothetical protein [Candidatus Spyradenecus faecavium]
MQDLLRRMAFAFMTIATGVSLLAAVRCLVPAYRQWQAARSQRDGLREQVDDLQRQIMETKRSIDRLERSPYYVEQLARANRRVADGEVLLVFED